MKIAFISFYSGTINRGIEVYADELATRLAKKHKVHLYQTGDPKPDVNYKIIKVPMKIDWDNKDMIGTFTRRILMNYWSRLVGGMAAKIFIEIIKGKYDIVIPLNGGWQTLLMRFATWISGGKMVVAGQSGIGWDDRINLYCFPDAFVALSKKALNWSRVTNSSVKSVLIPNGVDLRKFKPDGEKFKTNLKEPLVLAVGAFTEQKRLDLVIEAVARLDNVSLLLVGGGGDQEKKLKKMGKKYVGNRLRFTQVKHDEMPNIYRACDVFVLVSEPSEAFGIVFVEAMASGLPVVAVDDEQRREIVGNAGLFVKNPQDSKELANTIKNVLDKNWDDKPRERAKNYNWDDTAKSYEKLFLDISK